MPEIVGTFLSAELWDQRANHTRTLGQQQDHILWSRKPDCVAGLRGLELRNPGANYVFEISGITSVDRA
jgi:hypothetical protein